MALHGGNCARGGLVAPPCEVDLSSAPDRTITRLHVEGIRTAAPQHIAVLIADLIRTHIDRIAVPCIADMYAVSEGDLPVILADDLSTWARRATREIHDLPDVEAVSFLAELGELPPELVPGALREAIVPLKERPLAEVVEAVSRLEERFAEVAANKVVIHRQPKAEAKAKAKPRRPIGEPSSDPEAVRTPKPRAPRASNNGVDPARAEFIRKDITDRLTLREYAERGLKESILAAGVKHRSPYTDMTEAEILQEVRRMERERKLRSTGGRWVLR